MNHIIFYPYLKKKSYRIRQKNLNYITNRISIKIQEKVKILNIVVYIFVLFINKKFKTK